MIRTLAAPRIADDEDFENLRNLVDNHDNWLLELDKSNTKVYTRSVPGCEFNMVKILSHFDDCSADILFDVLHDPDYRKEWDSHMLASEEIGIINVNNDLGYYAMACPPPLQPRDFVLIRSWLDTGPRGEQMLLSRSVSHKDYPPRKGFVRAQSHITGFLIRTRSGGGCFLGYVAHCDPQGHLPPWLVNKVTHSLGPKMIKDLRRAALGYISWKSKQKHGRKPWRFPEDMAAPRIILEKHCPIQHLQMGSPTLLTGKEINSSIPLNKAATISLRSPNTTIPAVLSSQSTYTSGEPHNNLKQRSSFNSREILFKKKKKLFGKT